MRVCITKIVILMTTWTWYEFTLNISSLKDYSMFFLLFVIIACIFDVYLKINYLNSIYQKKKHNRFVLYTFVLGFLNGYLFVVYFNTTQPKQYLTTTIYIYGGHIISGLSLKLWKQVKPPSMRWILFWI